MSNRIKYQREDQELQATLTSRVNSYFAANKLSKLGNRYVYYKAGFIAVLYLLTYLSLFICQTENQLFLTYILLGPLTIFLALNVGHDAAHGIFTKNKNLNHSLTYVWDFLGANGQIWKYKHVESHHPLTNIHQVDHELETPFFLRLFPQTQWQRIHRYQYLYMPIVYCLYTLVWFCWRDYKDYFHLKKSGEVPFTPLDTARFFFGKLFFFFRMIFLPVLILPFGWKTVLLGFLLFNIAASIIATFALISTHLGEHMTFHNPDGNGNMPTSWIMHQMKTTSNFSTDNKWITALYGGFNHHLTHHLFPKISHAHYPIVTAIIKDVCREYQVELIPELPLLSAMRSHFKLLKIRGNQGLSLGEMEM